MRATGASAGSLAALISLSAFCLGVQALDGVGGVDDAAVLGWEGEERDESIPGAAARPRARLFCVANRSRRL
jgi:hypothetical protein